MTVVKTAISMDAGLLESVKDAVARGEAPSVSAYLARAVVEKQERRPYAESLHEALEEAGHPLTEEERAAYRRELGLT